MDVIRTHQGKRRYELPRVWWHYALTMSAAIIGASYGVISGEGLSFVLFWLGFWVVVGIFLEMTHRKVNFLMIHPSYLQYSERAWAPKSKRRGVRIRYKDIFDVKADSSRRTVTVLHRPESRLSRQFGIRHHQSSFALRYSSDVAELVEVLNVARAQAPEMTEVQSDGW